MWENKYDEYKPCSVSEHSSIRPLTTNLRFAEHGAILFCGVGNPESKRLDCTLLALATFPFNRERFKNGTKVQRDRPSTDPSAEADGK